MLLVLECRIYPDRCQGGLKRQWDTPFLQSTLPRSVQNFSVVKFLAVSAGKSSLYLLSRMPFEDTREGSPLIGFCQRCIFRGRSSLEATVPLKRSLPLLSLFSVLICKSSLFPVIASRFLCCVRFLSYPFPPSSLRQRLSFQASPYRRLWCRKVLSVASIR